MANKMDLKADLQVTADECLLFLKDYNRYFIFSFCLNIGTFYQMVV